jgi:hypothetical protein
VPIKVDIWAPSGFLFQEKGWYVSWRFYRCGLFSSNFFYYTENSGIPCIEIRSN